MKASVLQGRKVHGGIVEGEALVTTEAIGGYGAFDLDTGEVIEANHPLRGASVAGKVLVFSSAKGSSSWSVWHQALAINGVAPKAYVVRASISQVALGAVVLRIPTVTDLDRDPTEALESGDRVRVNGDEGTVEILQRKPR